MFKYTERQLAYFAGLLDGEGCVRIGKIDTVHGIDYRSFVTIVMTDKRPIDWLVKYIGGNQYIDKKAKKPKSKIAYQWNINGKRGIPIMKKVLPYLIVKKEQTLNYINFAETIDFKRKNIKDRTKLRKKLFISNKILNRKGR